MLVGNSIPEIDFTGISDYVTTFDCCFYADTVTLHIFYIVSAV